MRSKYREIGDFIKQVNVRNEEGAIDLLLGVNLDKKFIPSVANIHGTDLKKYKIIRKGQFGCKLMSVGRDKALPISRLIKYDEAIISSAYFVFEVKDENELLPEYLMMWFKRSESDRYLWFQSGGDVRGRITWSEFCSLPIIVPSIVRQREIVKEYTTIRNRIILNEHINQKLEETVQQLFKHWFVDFDFPNANGNPYKSYGGKMRLDDITKKEIPEKWINGSITNLAKIEDGDRGKNYPSKEELLPDGYCVFLSAENVTYEGFKFDENVFITKEKSQSLGNGKLQENDIVITSRGSSIGKLGYYHDLIEFDHIRINSGMLIIRPQSVDYSIFLFTLLKSDEFQTRIKNYLSGSAQPQIPIRDFITIPLIQPPKSIVKEFYNLAGKLQRAININAKTNSLLIRILDVLFSKMTQVEVKEMEVVS